MIVLKFGGTSLADAAQVAQVCDIVSRTENPVVVVSAIAGITDQIISGLEKARKGNPDVFPLREAHRKVLRGLGISPGLVEQELFELDEIFHGISLMGEYSPRVYARAVSYGERMSSKIVAAYFTSRSLKSRALFAPDIGMITDNQYYNAHPLPKAFKLIRQKLGRQKKIVPVITGFIGRDEDGYLTTLGRSGSDFTASIVGAALDAKEIQIWSTVDGVMTADPSVVPKARSLPLMSFEEAAELAYYGARILYPASIVPAIQKNIPVRVLNTNRPEANGTLIVKKTTKAKGVIKSIVYKENLLLIHITTPRLLDQSGFMGKIFSLLGKHNVVIDMIATTEVSVSLTTDGHGTLKEAVKELEEFATVKVESKKTIVGLVGEGMNKTPGLAGRIFSTVADANVNINMISQGASKIGIYFLIDDRGIGKAIPALHYEFFEKKRPRGKKTTKKRTSKRKHPKRGRKK
jgi:aspartate kinase